jgi:P27 family predicted phage terminase small subunit
MGPIVGELAALRLLTNLDRAALAAYCGAYALWAEATEAIQKYGAMIKSPQGFPIQSPYLAIANRQAEIMMRIASEFGFTPASRSRIATPPAAERGLLMGSTTCQMKLQLTKETALFPLNFVSTTTQLQAFHPS